MAEPDFQVVFDGQLIEGADLAEVKANIAKLFKTQAAKVEPLFSGRRTVIKRGLDHATAEKYRVAFERAGAVTTVVDANELPPSDTPQQTTTAPGGEANPNRVNRVEMAQAGRAPPPLVSRGLPSAPHDMTMAEPGAMLIDEPSTITAADIDTSHLTLSALGEDIAEHRKVAQREFDLSAFELAPPGTALGDET